MFDLSIAALCLYLTVNSIIEYKKWKIKNKKGDNDGYSKH